MSSGFRLCGASISGSLVRPAGVSAGDWVLENYELPVDRWGFTIFTNTPDDLGKVWVTFEELTQF